MSRVRTRDGKRTFYRPVYVKYAREGTTRKRLYLDKTGNLTNDPSLAFSPSLTEAQKQILTNKGFEPYDMPVLLTGKSDTGNPTSRSDLRFFVALCLGHYSLAGSPGQLMYYSKNGPVLDIEESHIFSSSWEAAEVGQTIFPNAVAVQEGRSFPYGSISYIGIALDNFSGMVINPQTGRWEGYANRKR